MSRNLLRFYYLEFRKKFLRQKKRKYLKRVVRGYHQEARIYKCLKKWQEIASHNRAKKQQLLAKFSENPLAAEILLE